MVIDSLESLRKTRVGGETSGKMWADNELGGFYKRWMISVGSEVIRNFETIALRSYVGKKSKLIPGQFFQGDWLLEALILTTIQHSG